MTFSTRSVLGALALCSLFTLAARAQPTEGTLVMGVSSQQPGIYHGVGPSPTVLQQFSTIATSALLMEPGNADMLVGTATTPSYILRITRSGVATTLQTLPSVDEAQGIALDQDGSLRVASIDRVYRLQPSGTGYSIVWTTVTGAWNAICRDPSSGDFLVGDFSSGNLVRMNRETDQMTTLSVGQSLIAGIAYNPVNGLFAVARLSQPNGLSFVNSGGGTVRSIPMRFANAVAVNEETGDVYAANNNGVVMRTDKDGVIQWTRDYGNQTIAALDVWGDRNLALAASGVAGTQQTVTLDFANSPQRPYCAALAFGDHPGFPVGNGFLNLTADSLFFLTACNNLPGLTASFLGTTGAGGEATAKFTIPAIVPPGTRLFVGAAVVNPALPGGLDISNTECVKVRP